ncbi:MT0933-like antitoxin protein [Lentzea jiangxiensis]|uniref:MT0933-like antitoxin protein n=2 Tax=Lentzea jiangxiensis TaxID=641025 RepID=A0A1H0NRV6_9PSEU|nr:MT0933-like antitoxin protein [Lentzea jiangxiensis]
MIAAINTRGLLGYPASGTKEHHMNFDEIKTKAVDLAEQHHEQVDKGVDAAADFLAGRFGHEEQVDSVAQKLKDILPGG